jgi:UDP-N-acetyl-D-mannosaminuronate dehydrogenase
MWVRNVTALSSAAVVGLGYIGLPTAVSLATGGLEVTGVDVDPAIVERVNRGETPFAEPDLSSRSAARWRWGGCGRSGRCRRPTPM